MATRRRIGVSAATTEAARRQLMQPVPSWEKVWVPISGIGPGSSSLKVYKWVKTEKIQQFSDDEGEVDEPLAPLPDEPELVEGDDDLEQEEAKNDNVRVRELDGADMDINQDESLSKVSSPKPKLMMQPSTETEGRDVSEGLDASLKQVEATMAVGDESEKGVDVEGLELDISGLGPDGLQLENAHNLSQLDGPDALIGGPLMDDSVDPFSETT